MPEPNLFARNHRIAMLIDADNAQPALTEKMLIETSKYGAIIIRRIYGDWTTQNLNGWKKILPAHAIQPMQQFQYTTGKNSTDSALIIDAMDLLHQAVADCFCLVSSDSDYTRLAIRIREAGFFVIGIGQKKTPRPFVVACDVFIYVENLVGDNDTETFVQADKTEKIGVNTDDQPDLDPLPLLIKAFEITGQENGWSSLSSMGTALRQLYPGFDTRTYGHAQLRKLLKAYPHLFELDENNMYTRLFEAPEVDP